ncbi:MAG: chitobiase/beta-hexosaminidase C-terminal domain-containing protein [Armatimonadetes bacterium]|nr:chitobiase/beta-hexosaminidase C-terminal domain-containing protein [Armatimonadota bacterium]
MDKWPLALGLLLAALTVAQAAPSAPSHLSDCAKRSPQYPGMLRASEVSMRSLVPRTANAKSPYDTLQALRDFHVTRLEWTYSLNADFVAKAKALGCTVSGAVANGSIVGLDRKQPDWFLPYSILNLNGEGVEAPWMRPWPGHTLWDCANNPKSRAGYLQYVKGLVDLGVRDIQRDDPTMNLNAVNWGACFCPYCLAGFRDYLQQHAAPAKLAETGVADLPHFDYAAYLRERKAPVGDEFRSYPRDYLKSQFIAFQEASTIAFHRWWRGELNQYAGRYVPVSSNNGMVDFGSVHQLFDFHIGELSYSHATPEGLHDGQSRARELGKSQNVTMPLQRDPTPTPEWTRRTRQTIGTCYALGMHIEAPWDTYLPIVNESPARYFGKPEECADLFALVRACPELLDDYEEAAVTGGELAEGLWMPATRPVTVWSPHDEVYAFTRALPGKPEAPIVVHLVDWSNDPKPCSVALNPRVLFAGKPLKIELITPRPYEKGAHDTAADSGDFSPLVQRVTLASGPVTTCEVPALQPWGLLVITPLPETKALWPPRLMRAEVKGEDAVAAEALSSGATVRYTTDATNPGPQSPVLRAPLPVQGLKEFRARCYRGGEASPVAVLSHLPLPGEPWQDLLVNSDFSQGQTGWQPVVFTPLSATALDFTTGPIPTLDGAVGAHLKINASDGVPYHVRLTQPVKVATGAQLQLRATLAASRPTQIRIGVQELHPPHRVVGIRVLEIGPRPQRVLLSPMSEHPDLQAQFQLDLGFAEPGTTVWLTGLRLRTRTTPAP